ncbi:MAG: alpha/beta hydrolase [Myxococcales bacterium]|nr:alpha/beta hydrolase [Myxococcales bacterium]MCB9733154.1 alpha/beta hydrolase [Deltaproteobacteria bacterium]
MTRLAPLALAAAAFLAACASSPRAAEREPAAEAAAPARFDARLSGYSYPYPVAVRAFEAQRQPLEMAYMDVAPTGAARGVTVLLLHGKNFSGAYWGPTIAALTEAGYRVVAPDQIGFGKSSKPERFQFSFHEMARETRDLLDDLGVGRVVVVGHSMGGMLAARFALMFPERTAKLALVNPIGLEDWQRVVPYVPVAEVYESELGKTAADVKAYMQASYFDGQWKPEYDALAEIQQGFVESPDKALLAWDSALTYDMIFTQPVVHDFPRIGAPTLLIIGQRDRTAIGKDRVPPEVRATLGDYPALGRAAHAAIPGSQLVEIEGVGHIPQLEAWPRYITALEAFLAAP